MAAETPWSWSKDWRRPLRLQVVGKEQGFGGLGGGEWLMAFLKAHRESVFYWTLGDLLPSYSLEEIKAKVLEGEPQWLINLSKGLIFPLFSSRSIRVKVPAIYRIETHPDCTQPTQHGQVARRKAILWDQTSVYRWPPPPPPCPLHRQASQKHLHLY